MLCFQFLPILGSIWELSAGNTLFKFSILNIQLSIVVTNTAGIILSYFHD